MTNVVALITLVYAVNFLVFELEGYKKS